MRRKRSPARVLGLGASVCAFTLLVLLGATNTWVHLASRGQQMRATTVPPRPVALVLGAGVQPDGKPTPFLAARLDVAADLWHRRKVQVILVSGDNRSTHYDEPTAMRRYLLSVGVPAESIVADYAGRDTYDSCARAQRIFGLQDLVVVSQTYHLPRALAICRSLGLDAIGVGDETMRAYAPRVWDEGRLRERAAALKAAWDVFTRRDPVLGPPLSDVQDALARAARAD
ncbi:SanA/YdcF family protein [Gephyromycinifex aptenodytis]|uniref:SanA/YdcF family protein n=1 Tax=Gephyromycinifex aptenodytis TaxID=2716227 RepID=UPI001B2FEB31|nr:ElyC/SanA/YdcF family protein [Gephyromycinifex aptenodytis]